MKTPTYLKPLRIRVGAAMIKVGSIAPCCGTVRVEGWIDAPSKAIGFEASRTLGEHLNRNSVGGYCDERDELKAVSFPFSFDCRYECVAPSYRSENSEEAIARVLRTLNRAKRHFSKLQTGVA